VLNRKVQEWADFVAEIAFYAMFTTVLLSVFCRYALSVPLMWAIEVSVFLFILVVFAGTAGAVAQNDHMLIRLVLDKLPMPLRRVVELGNVTVVWLVALAISIGAAQMARVTWEVPLSGVVPWLTTGHLYVVMFVPFLLATVFSVVQMWQQISILLRADKSSAPTPSQQ
jgi:TRAP-type C4-dicarboxylate transport system permease small subunit